MKKYLVLIICLLLSNFAMADYKKPNPEQLKNSLSDEQYKVTQQCGTEPPFRNAYWNNHEAGIYVDIVTGEPLFSSKDKFDSGTGWPSFTKPIDGTNLKEVKDASHGMIRTEVKSESGDSHLGHIFPDGPTNKEAPSGTGMRYCINSASLKFIPISELREKGYGEYLNLFQQTEVAILAGGCFWGMEELLRKLPGVTAVEVGYTGGNRENPIYDQVHTGSTGHAEAVKINFDPTKTSYEDILRFFFKIHDPTTKNRQGNDVGTQYRSAIFYEDEKQHQKALKIIEEVEASKKWPAPIVTEVVPASNWYKAEDYHQDFLQKNPGGYTCHYIRQ